MSTVISIKNLNAGYNEEIVIKDIELKIEKGDFVSLIGPNGSGKTTLLRSVNGIISPGSGKIEICEKEISLYKGRELARKISYVNQMPGLQFPFRIREILSMGRYPHLGFLEDFKFDNQIEKVLEEVDILDIKDKYIFEVSAGEFQLAMLAIALIQNTPVITLDEPTSHLDLYHQEKIMQVLKKRNEENGTTVIFVSHSINLASRYSDRIIVLKEGKIYKVGEPKEIITKELIKEVYNYDAKLINLPDYNFPLIW